MKKPIRWCLLSLMLGFGFSFSASVASGNQASSSVGDLGIHSGKHFYDQATIQDNPSKVASTRTWVSSGTAATGWIGSEARMYVERNGTTSLCGTSGMVYNPWATSSYTMSWLKESGCCGGAGYYFSAGKSGRWNGSGYSYYWSFRSPNLYLLA